ncbi:hypothetical protein CBR_g37436 [Chara braunii]|uniref:Uncharacterized protein n=1 Tax=Chara braunii TaxID=69332 RepID=A0A388LN36_CHABU|nr:hypothetical protein CBR_g37436 [Chara braunii]|eukprot:GBG83633.1 hypothetical protein CBR_g37436 [Chara braunii]
MDTEDILKGFADSGKEGNSVELETSGAGGNTTDCARVFATIYAQTADMVVDDHDTQNNAGWSNCETEKVGEDREEGGVGSRESPTRCIVRDEHVMRTSAGEQYPYDIYWVLGRVQPGIVEGAPCFAFNVDGTWVPHPAPMKSTWRNITLSFVYERLFRLNDGATTQKKVHCGLQMWRVLEAQGEFRMKDFLYDNVDCGQPWVIGDNQAKRSMAWQESEARKDHRWGWVPSAIPFPYGRERMMMRDAMGNVWNTHYVNDNFSFRHLDREVTVEEKEAMSSRPHTAGCFVQAALAEVMKYAKEGVHYDNDSELSLLEDKLPRCFIVSVDMRSTMMANDEGCVKAQTMLQRFRESPHLRVDSDVEDSAYNLKGVVQWMCSEGMCEEGDMDMTMVQKGGRYTPMDFKKVLGTSAKNSEMVVDGSKDELKTGAAKILVLSRMKDITQTPPFDFQDIPVIVADGVTYVLLDQLVDLMQKSPEDRNVIHEALHEVTKLALQGEELIEYMPIRKEDNMICGTPLWEGNAKEKDEEEDDGASSSDVEVSVSDVSSDEKGEERDVYYDLKGAGEQVTKEWAHAILRLARAFPDPQKVLRVVMKGAIPDVALQYAAVTSIMKSCTRGKKWSRLGKGWFVLVNRKAVLATSLTWGVNLSCLIHDALAIACGETFHPGLSTGDAIISKLKERNETPPVTPVGSPVGRNRVSGIENRPPKAREKRSREERTPKQYHRTKKRITYKKDKIVEMVDLRGSDDLHSAVGEEAEDEDEQSISEKTDGEEDEAMSDEGSDSETFDGDSHDADETDDEEERNSDDTPQDEDDEEADGDGRGAEEREISPSVERTRCTSERL